MNLIYTYQDQTKQLDEELATDLASRIPKKYTAWDESRQTQIDQAKKIRDAVYLKNPKKPSKQWQSNIALPDLFETKQTLKAHLWENIYSNPANMFEVEGMDESSEQNEASQKAMLVDSLKNMKIQLELDKTIDDLIDTGDSVLFVGWETKTKKVRRKKTIQEKVADMLTFQPKEKFVIEEKIIYDGAKVTRVDPLNFVFDPENKNNKIWQDFISPEDLISNKAYKIDKKLQEELKDLAKTEAEQRNASDVAGDNDQTIIVKNGKLETLEYWGDIKLKNGETLKDWLILVVARKYILRFEANPFVIDPFKYTNLIEDPDTKRGISILNYVLPMSELNSEILNKKIDALAFNIAPCHFMPKGAITGTHEAQPNGIIEYDEQFFDKPPIPLPVRSDQGWDFIQFIKGLMESTTGVFKNMSGNLEGDKTTATEIKARVGGQSSRLNMIIDTLNQNLVIPTIEAIADLTANFKFGEESIKGVIKGKSQFIKIDDTVRQGNYKYNYGSRDAVQEEKLKGQEFGQLVQQFMANQEFAAQTDVMKLFDVICQKQGYEDLSEKIKRDIPNVINQPSEVAGDMPKVMDPVGQLQGASGAY